MIRNFCAYAGKRSDQLLLVAFVLFSLTGCVTHVPVDEYTLARAAYESAKDADAVRYAPSLWYSAEQAYREGQRAYKDRRYEKATEAFLEAKEFAEKAENAARLARHQSGDILP